MSSVYAFRCATPHFRGPNSTLVLFAGPSGLEANDALTAISEQTKSGLAPELVLILAPLDSIEQARDELKNDPGVLAALPNYTALGLYAYDADGNVSLHEAIQSNPPSRPPLDAIRRQGLTTLFMSRGGVLEAGPTAHFEKPSGRLDTRFLRAAYALSEGAEIFFVAFWLLPILAKFNIRYAHIDTPSIASVVLAATLMRGGGVPVIRTFHSYVGLKNYDFGRDRPDLVLISASQSANMANKILSGVAEPELVVTLFSTADEVPLGASILCDLRYDENANILGLRPPSKPDARTRRIRLIGDHFTVEATPPRAIVPIAKDAPDVVEGYLAQLKGREVFRSWRNSLVNREPRAIWIDVAALIQTDTFRDWVRDLVARTIPVATKAIIHFEEDPGSKPLADAIVEEALRQQAPLSAAQRLTLADIERPGAKKEWPEDSSAVLVVGGVTGHGGELQAASRALRAFAKNSHRIYLAAAAMPSSKRAATILKSNLQWPSHRFVPMFEVFVDRVKMADSWEEEYEFLNVEEHLPGWLAKRVDLLKATSEGLLDNLFLPSRSGRLALRDNFAFWKLADSSGATQADVFATIAAILENLRTGHEVPQDRRLTNTVDARAILSAETFTRYNDGVIQAAMLRAALRIELNYTDAPDESRALGRVLIEMIELFDRPQGEALSEFLLALALERIKLCEPDLERVTLALSRARANLTDEQRWLADKLTRKVE